MKRFLSLLVILSIFTLTPALAQLGSFVSVRAVSGLGLAAGYGTLGAEVEWLDPFTVVYPRGSLAYMVGGGVWLGGSVTGGSLQAGAALYSGPDREGLFGAVRGGGAIVADNATRVGTLFGTLSLSGGYRLVSGPLELGLEGGIFFASTDINATQSLLYITPTLAISAGFRF
ncbi:hypothetical protein [Meiothermus sp.]|uniref:hypothetical protein n=1 Tax=Meiothermus sp. TaxID=1955249 RepID=UPI0021DE0BDA|nr:hypothetical protein [Meiothermus sp.]GIW33726.1 MAG: hypothetical protein KatS3mg072_1059 [Meiothermus sp.]